jgi:hypothetical protein
MVRRNVAALYLINLVVGTLLIGCHQESEMEIFGKNNIQGRHLIVSVRIGSEYFLKKFGFFRGSHVPQTAIWIEDEKGAFIDTIFMTYCGATGSWGNGEIERPSCFPVWSHKRGIETLPGYFMPTRERSLTDAITGATPKTNFEISWPVPPNMKPGVYRIFLEINSSYDYNKVFNNQDPSDEYYHPFNGQPSILWSNTIEIDDSSHQSELRIIGNGSNNGEIGTINPDLTSITTALKLADTIKVQYIP